MKKHTYRTKNVNKISVLINWNYPEQAGELFIALDSLKCQLIIVIESTGTYGDALRYQFKQLGFETHQIRNQRTNNLR